MLGAGSGLFGPARAEEPFQQSLPQRPQTRLFIITHNIGRVTKNKNYLFQGMVVVVGGCSVPERLIVANLLNHTEFW